MKSEKTNIAVVLTEFYGSEFSPLPSPVALWPLADRPIILHSLDQLMRSGIRHVILVGARGLDAIRKVIKESFLIGRLMRIDYVDAATSLTVGDALRELDNHGLIGADPFLLFDCPFVSAVPFMSVFDDFKNVAKDKNAISLVYLKKRYNSLPEADRISVKVTAPGNAADTKIAKIRRFEHRGQWTEVEEDVKIVGIEYTDLEECHVALCTPQFLTIFSDNFDYETMSDAIRGTLGDEQISNFTIYVSFNQRFAHTPISDVRKYIASCSESLAIYPYFSVSTNSASTVFAKIHTELPSSIKRPGSPGTYSKETNGFGHHCHHQNHPPHIISNLKRIAGSVYVGQDSHISGNGIVLDSCSIGRNCKLSDNVTLRNCVLWDNVVIAPTNQDEYIFLENCVIADNVVIRSKLKADHLFFCKDTRKSVHIPRWAFLRTAGNLTTNIVKKPVNIPCYSVIVPDFGNSQFSVYDTSKGRQRLPATNKPDQPGLLFNAGKFDMWAGLINEFENALDTDQEDTTESIDDYEPTAAGGLSLQAYEIHQTIYRAFLEDLPQEQLILEINGLKLAFNLVMQEIIEQSLESCITIIHTLLEKDEDFVEAVNKKFPFTFLKSYLTDEATNFDFMVALELCLMKNDYALIRASELMMVFYENEIVDENTIISYFEQGNISEEKLAKNNLNCENMQSVRTNMKPFLDWLEDADVED